MDWNTASCQAPVIAADGNVYYQDRYALQDGTRGGGIKYVGKGGGTPCIESWRMRSTLALESCDAAPLSELGRDAVDSRAVLPR